MNICAGYTRTAQFDDNGLKMEDLLKARRKMEDLLKARRLMAEAAERILDKMVADIFAVPARPEIDTGMSVARYELNHRSFMLTPMPIQPKINIVEDECFVQEVTEIRVRKKRFWEKFWASLSHWAYTPVEFYTVWEPAVFVFERRNTIYCHPSLAGEIRRKLAEA